MCDGSAVDAVLQVGGVEHRRRRQDHRPELDHREHRLPQLELVAEHDEHVVALPDAVLVQANGQTVGPGGHLRVAEPLFRAIRVDDPERDAVVASSDDVEPVVRPVEGVAEVRPPEGGAGGIGGLCGEQLVTGSAVRGGHVRVGHGPIMPHPSGRRSRTADVRSPT
ncbi:hypothetical protein QP157_17145 [Sphingomonas sp. LR61]